ncbi:MAG: hypothetical protein GX851_01600 [Clostridiales bacterium]|nr:hypothetical protein [Clostridiales bacterium]
MAKGKSSKKSTNIMDDPKVVVILLSVIIVVVIALSAYNIKQIQAKSILVKEQEVALEETQKRANYLNQLKVNAPTFLKMEEEYKLMMPESFSSEYEVMDSVCAYAAQYGLALNSVDAPVVSQSTAKEFTLTLSVSGEYRNIINFCNYLTYGQKQIYRIDGFTMDRGSTDAFSREATIVVSTFSKG